MSFPIKRSLMNNEQKSSSPLENVMNIVRNLQEDVPVNNVSSGHIAGAVPGKEPPVFLPKKKRKPTPIGRYGTRRTWMQNGKS